MRLATRFSLVIAIGLSSCATSAPPAERGPDGTVAYYVEVDSDEPGARIEVNNEFVGVAPMTLRIWGDRDGTFHNFGSYKYVVRAYPTRRGEQPQTKEFATGGWFTSEDMIPHRIYFLFGPSDDYQKQGTN